MTNCELPHGVADEEPDGRLMKDPDFDLMFFSSQQGRVLSPPFRECSKKRLIVLVCYNSEFSKVQLS